MLYAISIWALEAMFPEHWERGTGTWTRNTICETTWDVSILILYVPNRVGTRSKFYWNDVPGTIHGC
jgi:hypothetical protein